jgi:hypothetical protein
MVERVPIAVAYKYRRKMYVKEFTDLRNPDPIISPKSKKLPQGAEIIQIGVGKVFSNQFKSRYL